MSSYWGFFSEPGYLRPSARCASPAPQALPLQTVALKAGAGNRSGKVLLASQLCVPWRACAPIPDGNWPQGNDATFQAFERLFVGESSEDAAARRAPQY